MRKFGIALILLATVVCVAEVRAQCDCPNPGNPDADGVLDVSDLVAIRNRAFNDTTCVTDPLCPVERCDFNADSG